jgi:hypothetical protein
VRCREGLHSGIDDLQTRLEHRGLIPPPDLSRNWFAVAGCFTSRRSHALAPTARRAQGWAEGRGSHRTALAVSGTRRFHKTIRQRSSLDCPTTCDYPHQASSLHSIQSCRRSPEAHDCAMTDQARQSSIDEFQCARCGAVYDVAITHRAPRAEYDAVCIVCCEVMNEWHGTVGRAYTLKSQPAHA